MVLVPSLSRPLLGRSVGSIALRGGGGGSSSTRGFRNVSAASAIASPSPSSSTLLRSSTAASRRGAAAVLPPHLTTKLGPSTTIRSLTGVPREKVKVLLVLYDGGKHAEEVSSFSSPQKKGRPNPNPKARPGDGMSLLVRHWQLGLGGLLGAWVGPVRGNRGAAWELTGQSS